MAAGAGTNPTCDTQICRLDAEIDGSNAKLGVTLVTELKAGREDPVGAPSAL